MHHTAIHRARRGRILAAPRPLLLAVIVAAACHPERTPLRDRALVITITADPDLLFPPSVVSTNGLLVSGLIFDRLAEPDSTLDILDHDTYRPRLAERWSWAPDSLSIEFHLSPTARWHDGEPVTADDVRFTFDVYRDREVASPAAPLLSSIDSVTVRDPHTAVFWFGRRHAEQLFEATYHMRILPAHILAAVPRRGLSTSAFARAPVGSGPFRFTRWVPAQVIELAANDGYHRARPRFERVLFVATPNPHAALAKLRVGEADFLPRLHPHDVATATADDRVRIVSRPSLSNGMVLFNLRNPRDTARPHPVLGDRAVRAALSLGVDRHAVIAGALGVLGTPARGPLPARLLEPDTAWLAGRDVERARALLDSAGWSAPPSTRVRHLHDQELTFTLMVAGAGSTADRAAVLLQQQFAELGAEMRIEPVEHTTALQRLATHRFDAALITLDWDPSPASMRQLWSAEQGAGGSNFGGYRNPAFDSLITSATIAGSREEARALYRHALAQLVHDAPALWLYDIGGVGAAHRCLRHAGLRADEWWTELAEWSLATLPCAPAAPAGPPPS